MNIEDFRNDCLSLPGVTEKMPFAKAGTDYDRNLLVFSVGGKWFCFVNIDVFDCCVLKSTPQESVELRAQYEGVKPGYHMNHRHWISVYFKSDLSDGQIRSLVRRAYDLVVASLPKKARLAIGGLPAESDGR